jgi:hypothetical protein
MADAPKVSNLSQLEPCACKMEVVLALIVLAVMLGVVVVGLLIFHNLSVQRLRSAAAREP